MSARGDADPAAAARTLARTLARAEATAVLRELIAPGTRCALVDFPRHANVGDSAIWLGERALLRDLGVDLAYLCDRHTFAEDDLARCLPSGTILLHGGGNLGDLWPHHQQLRERVIRAFPRHRIIQLPQSVHFDDRRNLARAREVFDAHPDLTLLLRDTRSLHRARDAFAARSLLAPDSAFALQDLPAAGTPHHHLLWLGRTDHEAAPHAEPPPDGTVHRTDWNAGEGGGPDWPARLRGARLAIRTAADALRRTPTARSADALADVFDAHARLHLRRGCRLLGGARAVVTDRLHAHLLCLLLGLEHTVLDDRNGKISSYRDTWRHRHAWPQTHMAPTPHQALLHAAAQAAGPREATRS
ncbi:polysaccharide pyruvyl transferase family protein [Kitasatospora sp. NPDC005856]|uniref:polysaccharide pyruvyl transferase family protein n=1 Tax=Kitasatospora sp. NPDC005856 TaxID=3154566 RepID=UPI00340A7A7D